MTGYDALLLDHDGVIVDVADGAVVRGAAADALRAVGVEDPTDDQIETLGFAPTRAELDRLAEAVGTRPATLWRHRDDNLDEVLTAATRDGGKEPYPGVDALAGLDRPVGIVSTNQRRTVEAVLDHHGLAGYVDALTAREPRVESLDRKKPAPTFLEQTLEELGVTDALYVGDRESDVVAGRRAGLDTALIRREHNGAASPEHGPTYEIEGLDEAVGLVTGD